MDNKQNEQIRKIQQRSIVPPVLPNPAVGESKGFTMSLGQINHARRVNALNRVRELIHLHHFTLEEIEGR